MRKTVLTAALAVAALPVAANASFVVTYPSTQPVPVEPAQSVSNNFYQGLALAGITTFASTGATLSITGPGVITFEYFAKEALLLNRFTTSQFTFLSGAGVNNFTVGPDATGVPQNLGSYSFTPATFNPTFSSEGIAGSYAPGSEFFGIGLPGSTGSGSYVSESVWLLFDDNTGNPDDNHDDLIIRATFAVPEPSTWAMMILGFGVIGLVMRRRTQQRVSFV